MLDEDKVLIIKLKIYITTLNDIGFYPHKNK